jgi:hypothetical protein
MLMENEDNLFEMSFELILSQLPLLPVKFMFGDVQL